MINTTDKKSFSPGLRASSGAFTMPLLLALAACGGRYELGEMLPVDPSGSSGAGSSGFEPSAPRGVGHVIIDELGDLDAPLSRSLQNPAGDVDGDGYDDWFATPPYDASTVSTPRQYAARVSLVYGGPRIAGDLYRDDRLGPVVIHEANAPYLMMPAAAGDLDGDGFGDILYRTDGYGDHLPTDPHREQSQGQWFLEHWDGQRAYVLYGGPRTESSSQIQLHEVAVPFLPDAEIQSRFGPEQVLASDPLAEGWRVWTKATPTPLGDLDSDGFDDLAYTYSVSWTGWKGVDDTDVSTSARIDAVTHVFYGGPNRWSADDVLASAAAVLPGVTDLHGVGDIDGDGRRDLVAKKNGQVFLLPGGGGRLSGPVAAEQVGSALLPADEWEGGWATTTREVIGVGDLDADGVDDLMVKRWEPLGNAALLFYGAPHRFDRALPDASADATFHMDEPHSTQQVQRLGDWDGDGHEDLMVVSTSDDDTHSEDGWQNPRSKAVVIRGGSERYSGVFSAPQLAAAPDHRSLAGDLLALPLGDIDGDGRVDLEVWSDTGIFVKYGSPFEPVIY